MGDKVKQMDALLNGVMRACDDNKNKQLEEEEFLKLTRKLL